MDELWNLVRRAHPFRRLPRGDFDAVLEMLAEGVSTRRGRRSAHLHLDRVHGVLRARRGARLAAITSGGAIPDTADYDVIEEPSNAVRRQGQRGLRRRESGRRHLPARQPLVAHPPRRGRPHSRRRRARRGADHSVLARRGAGAHARAVRRGCRPAARGGGAAPADPPVGSGDGWWRRRGVDPRRRSRSSPTSRDRRRPRRRADAATPSSPSASSTRPAACSWSCTRPSAAASIAPRSGAAQALLRAVRLRAAGGGHRRRHRPLARRAAQLPAGERLLMLRPSRSHSDLIQAALAAPMFGNRWRWNASAPWRCCAQRRSSACRCPFSACAPRTCSPRSFPAQLACGDNHPSVRSSCPIIRWSTRRIDNCLARGDGRRRPARRCSMRSAAADSHACRVETPAPSPMSHEILNANPYAFLDDAPLEERRARAVSLRRIDPDLAAASARSTRRRSTRCARQAWPEARDADEVHDALLTLCVLPAARGRGVEGSARRLDRRAPRRPVDVGPSHPLTSRRSARVWCGRIRLERFGSIPAGRSRRPSPASLGGRGRGEGADLRRRECSLAVSDEVLTRPLVREQCGDATHAATTAPE